MKKLIWNHLKIFEGQKKNNQNFRIYLKTGNCGEYLIGFVDDLIQNIIIHFIIKKSYIIT